MSADNLDIGHGWSVTVPVHGIWGSNGEDFGDLPVEPHESVAWSRADYCSGRDPDLALALRRARSEP